MIWMIFLFLLGFAIIIKGGDWFIEASIWVAEVTGMPKMLIGATVVSLATTLPEFTVSVIAVVNGASGLGAGNALGSVICNTGLILALSICIKPTPIDRELFYKKSAIMFFSLVLLFIGCLDRTLSLWDSMPLFLMFFVFIFLNVNYVRKQNRRKEAPPHGQKKTAANILKFVAGAAGIMAGARLLVGNGTKIAQYFGISDGIIGVTIIALGTSLPELVTTVSALKKKESLLGIGNILGANILNITMILSSCVLISGGGLQITSDYMPMLSSIIPRTVYIDIPVAALLFLLLIVPPVFLKGRLKRAQGAWMLAVYAAFIIFLILNV